VFCVIKIILLMIQLKLYSIFQNHFILFKVNNMKLVIIKYIKMGRVEVVKKDVNTVIINKIHIFAINVSLIIFYIIIYVLLVKNIYLAAEHVLILKLK